MAIELGSEAQDRISGFKGIVIAETRWLYGCLRYSVQPQKLDKEGKVVDFQTFDEGSLKILKTPQQTKIFPTSPSNTTPKSASKPGGPRSEPKRRLDVRR